MSRDFDDGLRSRVCLQCLVIRMIDRANHHADCVFLSQAIKPPHSLHKLPLVGVQVERGVPLLCTLGSSCFERFRKIIHNFGAGATKDFTEQLQVNPQLTPRIKRSLTVQLETGKIGLYLKLLS